MAVMALSGPLTDREFIVALGVAVVFVLYLLLHRSPRLAVGFWITVLCFVPVWIGLGLGFGGNFYVPAASGAALVVTAALLPTARFRFTLTDGLVVLLILVGTAALLTGNKAIALSFLLSLCTYFVVGFALGRLAPSRVDIRWIYGAIGVAFTIASVLAIIESLTGVNFFTLWRANNISFATWGSLQSRGGVLRAEGAFGHSIALGSSLALAIPLTLATRFRFWIRGVMVLLMLIATTLTFSRIGIIGALLGLALSILFLSEALSIRRRIVLATAGVILSLVLLPVVNTVFTDAGTEATGSAAYRGNLLSLISDMNLIGVASSAHTSASGQVYFGNFRSIDSQLILSGLSGGLIVLAVVVVALLVAIGFVLSGRATAPTIAVVAQIPAFATVALITQYSIFVWFVVGLAVATQLAREAPRNEIAPSHLLFVPGGMDRSLRHLVPFHAVRSTQSVPPARPATTPRKHNRMSDHHDVK